VRKSTDLAWEMSRPRPSMPGGDETELIIQSLHTSDTTYLAFTALHDRRTERAEVINTNNGKHTSEGRNAQSVCYGSHTDIPCISNR
jgi:hypothetical protein